MAVDVERRFGGVSRLYGTAGATRLSSAKVAVVGIGGVGSWAAEALARSGVGALLLVDLDMVAESNTNRQIHALDSNFGKAKVRAMAERIAEINPNCQVCQKEEFATPENIADLLEPSLDAVIDATDQVRLGELTLSPTITLGEATISNTNITYGDFDIFRVWGLDEQPALLIGMDVLGTLAEFAIDYRRRELQLLTRGS